jgi:hypothetical protein
MNGRRKPDAGPTGRPVRKNGSQAVLSRSQTPIQNTQSQASILDYVSSEEQAYAERKTALDWLHRHNWHTNDDHEEALTSTMLQRMLRHVANLQPHRTQTPAALLADIQQGLQHLATVLYQQDIEPVLLNLEDAITSAVENTILPAVMSKVEARLAAHPVPPSLPTLHLPTSGSSLTGNARPSYAQAAGTNHAITHLPREAQAEIAHQDKIARQLRVSFPGSENATIGTLSPLEIVTKANLALETALPGDHDSHTFVASKAFPGGDIILLARTAETIAKLRSPEARTVFLQHFDAFADIKDRLTTVAINFVPIHISPEGKDIAEGLLREMEEENYLPPQSIASARWLKNPENRTDGQRVATLTISLSDDHAAHRLHNGGLTFRRAIFDQVSWLLLDPAGCYKCGALGHMARACREVASLCLRCGHAGHAAKECGGTAHEHQYCSNCRQTGHVARNRDCPKFAAAVRRQYEQPGVSQQRHEIRRGPPPISIDEGAWHTVQPQRTRLSQTQRKRQAQAELKEIANKPEEHPPPSQPLRAPDAALRRHSVSNEGIRGSWASDYSE